MNFRIMDIDGSGRWDIQSSGSNNYGAQIIKIGIDGSVKIIRP